MTEPVDVTAEALTTSTPPAADAPEGTPVVAEPEAIEPEATELEATAPDAPAIEAEASTEPVAVDEASSTASAATEAEDGDDDAPEAAPVAGAPPKTDAPEVVVLRTALADKTPLPGKVFGWNEHGFHVSLVEGKIAAFCPRSEMEVRQAKDGASYLDQVFDFRVLKVQRSGKRVVVSRAEILREEQAGEMAKLRGALEVGKNFEGTVTSLTDFGAFVDIGGVEGLVHVSEIGYQRVAKPSEVLSIGQTVTVQIIKIEKGGKRLSLSMKALEADPWADVRARFPEGTKIKGKVENTGKFGVIIELEPGLTGLLPASEITLPPGSSLVRVYPKGREVEVLVGEIDSRRRRIALMLEGSRLEGSRTDFSDYKKRQGDAGTLGTLAAALARLNISSKA